MDNLPETNNTEEPLKVLHKSFLNPNINIPTILETLNAASAALDAYLTKHDWEDFVVFLDNLPEFPKERVPRKKNIACRVIKQLEVKYGEKTHSRDFAAIANSVDEILRVDAGPQGALLQNMVKSCLQRVADLEASSSVLNPDKKVEDSIVKYVGEIRNLMMDIGKYHKETLDTQSMIASQVKGEVGMVMEAVKETAMALFPAKIEDFQKILISKLTQYQKGK